MTTWVLLFHLFNKMVDVMALVDQERFRLDASHDVMGEGNIGLVPGTWRALLKEG